MRTYMTGAVVLLLLASVATFAALSTSSAPSMSLRNVKVAVSQSWLGGTQVVIFGEVILPKGRRGMRLVAERVRSGSVWVYRLKQVRANDANKCAALCHVQTVQAALPQTILIVAKGKRIARATLRTVGRSQMLAVAAAQ